MKDNNHTKPNEQTDVPVEQFGSMSRDDIGFLGKNRGKKNENPEGKQVVPKKQPRRDMGDFL